MESHATEWGWLLGRAAVPVAAGCLGGLLGALGADRGRRFTEGIVYFAAGAFLAVASLHLLPESAHAAGWPGALVAASLGWVLCARLANWSGAFCPACVAGLAHATEVRPGLPLLTVVAIHSLLDGVGLATPEESATALFSLAVVLHKLPEGLAIAAVARSGGASRRAAVALTAAVESCTFLGLLLGVALGAHGTVPFGWGLGLVAGSFGYLVALTLKGLPESRNPLVSAGVTAAGAILIAGAATLLGEAH